MNGNDDNGETDGLMELLPWILLFVSVVFNLLLFIALYQQCRKRKAIERRHMFEDDTTQMVTMSSRSGYNVQGDFQEITSDASVDYVTMAQN